MANDNFYRGLYPRNLNFLNARYYKAGTASDIFMGMPVALGADGLVVPAVSTTSGFVAWLGSAIGFIDGNKGSLPTNDPFLDVSDLGSDKEPYILVADDPQQEYIVQEDTGGAALTQTGIGNWYTLVASLGSTTDSGNLTTGWALLELDRSTGVTTTAGQVQLLRVLDGINSDGTPITTGNYCKWVVRIVTHQKGPGSLAAPV